MQLFDLFFLGLGRPWVAEFVGFVVILICFPTRHTLVNRQHPITAVTYQFYRSKTRSCAHLNAKCKDNYVPIFTHKRSLHFRPLATTHTKKKRKVVAPVKIVHEWLQVPSLEFLNAPCTVYTTVYTAGHCSKTLGRYDYLLIMVSVMDKQHTLTWGTWSTWMQQDKYRNYCRTGTSGCKRFTKFSWVGKHVYIIMKPTNSPTQDQPNSSKK